MTDQGRMTDLPACKNALHKHPMPDGYIQAHTEAERRFSKGWENLKCPDCGLYGWRKP